MSEERSIIMDSLIAADADLIDTEVTDEDREVFIRLSGPDDEGANRIRRGLTYTWEVGLIARHRQAAYTAGYQAAADRIEALSAENERLREAGKDLGFYAGHDDSCDCVKGWAKGPCNCGYTETWKQWSAALGGTK